MSRLEDELLERDEKITEKEIKIKQLFVKM